MAPHLVDILNVKGVSISLVGLYVHGQLPIGSL